MASNNNSAEEIRKKQKLKSILSIIGESLKEYFIAKINEIMSKKPNYITITSISAEERGTSKSKVYYVSYHLNTDLGEFEIPLAVKFASSQERFEKEIANYQIFQNLPLRYPLVNIPDMIYKSPSTRCIIYEGIKGTSFRESTLDKNYKHQLAGQVLAAFHGTKKERINIEPYKKILLYLISVMNDETIEQRLLDNFLPYLVSLESALGGTIIHGDYHQGNLLFKDSSDTLPKTGKNKSNVSVYLIDTEFATPSRDRFEDIGTFYAKPMLKEYLKFESVNNTLSNIKMFVEGYNLALRELGATFKLGDLYPKGITLPFHLAFYFLYEITEQITEKGLYLDYTDIQKRVELIDKILTEPILADIIL